MLTVICINTGNYLGRGRDYVAGLRAEVAKNLTLPHRFVCLTDDPEPLPGVETVPARFGGWWEKIRMFEPGLFSGRCAFLDLDTYVVGNLDPLFSYNGPFALPHDLWNPKGLGPAVMLFDPDWAAFIFEEWAAAGFPMKDPRGDQAWIEDRHQGRMRKMVDIVQDIAPGACVSFKGDCAQGIPEGVALVCFHGRPRPHETSHPLMVDWARAWWHARIKATSFDSRARAPVKEGAAG